MINAAFEFEFMQHALLAGFLASVVCGVVGTFVVVNRIAFLSGGIAHAAYGGIGLSFFMGWPPMAGAVGFTLAASMIMAWVSLAARHRVDALIGVIWALGMALGVILMDLTPGYHVDLMSYLFGSLLSVSLFDLYIMVGAAVVILGLTIWFYYDFLIMSFDHEFAAVRGFKVTFLYFLLISMLGVGVVLLIQVTGLILVIALLTIPPFIMENITPSLGHMMAGSILLSAGFIFSGLYLSFTFNLTSGASVILVAGAFFFLTIAAKRMWGRRTVENNGQGQ